VAEAVDCAGDVSSSAEVRVADLERVEQSLDGEEGSSNETPIRRRLRASKTA